MTTKTVLFLLMAAGLALPLEAQESPHISMSAGISEFDLSGTGTEAAFDVRYGHPLAGPLALDAGVGLVRPEQQFGERTWFWQGDVLLQLERRSGRLQPYGGIGLGGAADVRSDDFGGTELRFVTAATLGLRTPVTERGKLQLEGRVRMIGTGFNGSIAQLTLGWAQYF